MMIHPERPKQAGRCISSQLNRVLACSIGFLLALQGSFVPLAAQNQAGQSPVASAESSSKTPDKTASHNPSLSIAMASPTEADALPDAPMPQESAQPQSSSSNPQQGSPQQPVGTAAAPYEKPTGVPGSRPAGAVIAPARQKRVRAIVVKFGLLLAGGAAIGTVVGLSRASHSQP